MAKATKSSAAPKRQRGKRRERKNVPRGQAHVQSTFNNTIVTITDPMASRAHARARHTQRKSPPKLLAARQSKTVCAPSKFLSRVLVLAVKQPCVPCNPLGCRSAQSPMSPQFRITAADRQSDGAFNRRRRSKWHATVDQLLKSAAG